MKTTLTQKLIIALITLTLSAGRGALAQFILGEPTSLGEHMETGGELAPELSADGLTLYYQKNNYSGNPDIYAATRDCLDCPWTDPQPVIFNTDRGEASPALSPDGLELYFDDGHRPGYPAPVRPYLAAYKPIANLAHMHLRQIKSDRIEELLRSHGDRLDPYTKAHLVDASERIEKALNAQFIQR